MPRPSAGDARGALGRCEHDATLYRRLREVKARALHRRTARARAPNPAARRQATLPTSAEGDPMRPSSRCHSFRIMATSQRGNRGRRPACVRSAARTERSTRRAALPSRPAGPEGTPARPMCSQRLDSMRGLRTTRKVATWPAPWHTNCTPVARQGSPIQARVRDPQCSGNKISSARIQRQSAEGTAAKRQANVPTPKHWHGNKPGFPRSAPALSPRLRSDTQPPALSSARRPLLRSLTCGKLAFSASCVCAHSIILSCKRGARCSAGHFQHPVWPKCYLSSRSLIPHSPAQPSPSSNGRPLLQSPHPMCPHQGRQARLSRVIPRGQ